ncbi:hypothetical protein CHRYSEOSP005_11270 [Chryseobacterium sp. Alg-005]|uniref:tetratricopeptide repeat-containing sensor histidine kinase n=1 Tax=Chryseobacterium sp. Alg-005 TaxID=3159516 RepID=UPI003555AB00
MKRIIFFILITIISCNQKKNISIDGSPNENLLKAQKFRDNGNSDSAYIYYGKAKDDLLKARDSTEAARAITNLAIIECDNGDYQTSIASSIDAKKLLYKKKDSVSKYISSVNYNSIAIASKNLRNYGDAIHYYNLAVSLSKTKIDSLAFYNNIGDAYLEQKDLKSAKTYFQKAISTSDQKDYARALNNLAKVKFLENNNYNPIPELSKAWKIRVQESDDDGLNSSFATIADYYIKKNDHPKALFYAREMYKVAQKNKSPDDRLEALHKLIRLDPENYSENFSMYAFLKDSLQTTRNNSKNQFAIIRYKTQQLKTEIAEKQTRILWQTFTLGALLVAIIILILILGWFRKKQKIQQQKSELDLKNTQLALSKKVHDVVANGVYQILTEIENQEEIDKNRILYKLESVYEKSRDISYENLSTDIEEDFRDRISHLLSSFQNENRRIFIVGNEENIWSALSDSKKEEVFHVLQELMVNMKKHSEADLVVVRFEKDKNSTQIFYSDNGIGIQETHLPKNGLRNTENRIHSMNGTIIFDLETEKGLKINISFPDS